jgi:hypothetical protein
MRAMGPGSVSSLLKIALDVFYVALWAGAGAFAIAALGALIFSIGPDLVVTTRDATGALTQVKLTSGQLAAGLAAASVYTAVLLLIVSRLRKVFGTLTAGDPFQPENVRRLRTVGLGLAALEGLNMLYRFVGAVLLPPGVVRAPGGWPDLTAWFSVLVVFVLAEVFREGARLRREAELTI